ncbi:MAG: FKBP-type peptidylprolyl isomerase [Chitinophagaceae bacterium]|nr:MAG: FKBP-type peptidylprolyl isomerase [Chitinophagaceae bacterium]
MQRKTHNNCPSENTNHNMIRSLFAAGAAAFVLSGCLKAKDTGCRFQECAVVAPDTERANLRTYLTNNNIVATEHCSGAYYQVIQQGGGATPTGCSTVNVTYSGYLTNGTRFDTATNVSFQLASLIRGWTALIPKVNSGGRIKLFIPPTLGYGASAQGSGSTSIPGNSILVFNITVNDVQ